MTILERIEKTYKKHIGNNAEMSPKRVPAKVSNLTFLLFWGVPNDLYWGLGGLVSSKGQILSKTALKLTMKSHKCIELAQRIPQFQHETKKCKSLNTTTTIKSSPQLDQIFRHVPARSCKAERAKERQGLQIARVLKHVSGLTETHAPLGPRLP